MDKCQKQKECTVVAVAQKKYNLSNIENTQSSDMSNRKKMKIVDITESSSSTAEYEISQHERQKRALQSCKPGNWLVDDAINFFIDHLKKKLNNDRFVIFNSYFWTKLVSSKIENVNSLLDWNDVKTLWKADYWLVPMHMRASHWCLAVVCIEKCYTEKVIYVYIMDSLQRQPIVKICKVLRKFIALTSHQKNTDHKRPSLDVVIRGYQLSVPKQNNGYDCGVFMLQYILKYVINGPIHNDCPDWFQQNSIDQLRQRLYNAIEKHFV